MKKITARDIDSFQVCSRKIWLKFFEKDFEPGPASGFMKYLAEQGNYFERLCIESLDPDEVFEPHDYDETISLMKKGVKYIYQGVLEDDKRIGKPDMLRRNDSGKSNFGDYSYDVIDVKSATLYSELEELNPSKFKSKRKDLQKNYGLQVWHYKEMLSDILGSDVDLYLWVIDREGYSEVKFEDSVLSSFKHKKSIDEIYSNIFLDIEDLKEDNEIEPFKVGKCNECDWYPLCLEKMEEVSHCSLIKGVEKRGLNDLNNLGIKTISDFYSKVDYSTKIKYVLNGEDSKKTDRLKTQAQALLEDKDFYLGEPLVGFDCDYLLFYDIEGEMGNEFEYLHGVWEVNKKTASKRYVSFITNVNSEEGDVWNSFLDYVRDISSKGSFKIIYFANYEKVAWKNLSSKYDTSEEDLKLLMNNSFDILKGWIDNKLILPRYNYSIKTVAPYYGFSWKCKENKYVNKSGEEFSLTDADGGESIAWLDYWMSGEEVYKQIILDYNKDDCVATEYVYLAMLDRYGK